MNNPIRNKQGYTLEDWTDIANTLRVCPLASDLCRAHWMLNQDPTQFMRSNFVPEDSKPTEPDEVYSL